jgi:hypothetical protein
VCVCELFSADFSCRTDLLSLSPLSLSHTHRQTDTMMTACERLSRGHRRRGRGGRMRGRR